MFGKSLYTAVILSTYLLNNQVAGVELRAYQSSLTCTDPYFYCYNHNANTCCGNFPAAFGYSVQVTDLPLGSQGNIFGDTNCITSVGTVFGEGSKCWNGGGVGKMRSMSWNIQGGRESADDVAECASPDRFSFMNENGQSVQIHVPKGQADNIARLFQTKDFKGLGQFERVKATD